MTSANCQGTDLQREANFNLTPEQIRQACNWQEAEFDREFRTQIEAVPEPDPLPDCSRWDTN